MKKDELTTENPADAKPVLYEGGIFTHYTRLEARKKKKKK